MDFNEMIALGNQAVGEQKRLAEVLGVQTNVLSNAKAGQRGIPDYACFKLAEIIGINPAAVIAANALITEKNPERRAIFAPFVIANAANALSRLATTANKAVHKASSLQ